MYDVLLNFVNPDFSTPEMRADFLSFKRSDGNFLVQLLLLVVAVVYVGSRFWFASDPTSYTTNPAALAVVVVAVPGMLCYLAVVVLRLTTLAHEYHITSLRPWQSSVTAFLGSRWGQVFDDASVVCAAVSAGLYLLAQAAAHACPGGVDVFRTQGCNPGAGTGTVPPETVVLPMAVVLVIQAVLRGCSRGGILLGWIAVAALVNASLAVLRSEDYLWVNLELAALMCLSYEKERNPMRHFIKVHDIPPFFVSWWRLDVLLHPYIPTHAARTVRACFGGVRSQRTAASAARQL